MERISAIIITLNEERNIARCLTSLKEVADEMIVADSNSQDRTVEIAKDLGAKVIHVEWEGYVQTKNKVNHLAKNPWILALDADEALSDELKASILQAKKDLDGVYTFNRLTNYCGKWIRHSGWYPDARIRLFHRDEAEWKGGAVHELIEAKGGIPHHHLAGDLHHYSYYSVEEHRERTLKYVQLFRNEGTGGQPLRGIFSAIWAFIRNYFFRLGFLDGKYGWIICRYAALEKWWKYK